MILLTGGAGFIGSNILAALNAEGRDDVIVVDNLTDGSKCRNLAGRRFADYLDVEELVGAIREDSLPQLSAICHQGAPADSATHDGKGAIRAHHTFSKVLLNLARRNRCPFVYASSSSVYGDGSRGFRECLECERPRSPYGVSKWIFDEYVRRLPITPAGNGIPSVIGFRYFNVYGPGESHKGAMASVAWQCFSAVRRGESPCVFVGSESICRDFVSVADVAAINVHFLKAPPAGVRILNVGSGEARSFLDVATCVSRVTGGSAPVAVGFPEHFRGQYQRSTCADLSNLRASGYTEPLRTLEEGIEAYHREFVAAG